MSIPNPNPNETPEQKQARWIAGCKKVGLNRLANPEYTDIKYVCKVEDQLGYVDFDDDCYSDPRYRTYGARRNFPKEVLEDGQDNALEKTVTLLGHHPGNEEFTYQDLDDLRLIGVELCQWNRTDPVNEAASGFETLVQKAAKHYKAGTNAEDYDYLWSWIVALYLKLDDLSFYARGT